MEGQDVKIVYAHGDRRSEDMEGEGRKLEYTQTCRAREDYWGRARRESGSCQRQRRGSREQAVDSEKGRCRFVLG